MNGIILYKSKYGSTKRYAEWLSLETGFDLCDVEKAKIQKVEQYDIILFGGGIYASGIAGLNFLKKNIGHLDGKKVLVFCDGASPYDESAFLEIKKRNMRGALEHIPLFYCRGEWDMQAMSFVDRNLCKMLRKAVAKKEPSEYELWETALMAAGEEKCDWTDKTYLKPILEESRRYDESEVSF